MPVVNFHFEFTKLIQYSLQQNWFQFIDAIVFVADVHDFQFSNTQNDTNTMSLFSMQTECLANICMLEAVKYYIA